MLHTVRGIENAKRLLLYKNMKVDVIANRDKTFSVRGVMESKRVKGESITVVLHLDKQEQVWASDMYSLDSKTGKYLIAPTRTLYPSKQRIKLPVDVSKCLGKEPYWANLDRVSNYG